MSAIQVTINGVPDQVVTAYMTSLPILSSGLDQNANTTLNNVNVQNIPDGGNIKIGDSAMNSAVNPITNIAIGYNALPIVDGSTLNSDNIAIGQASLVNVTTGGKNIGIGLNALTGLSTESNTIGIGNNTQASAANGIIIGNNAQLTNNNSGILKFNSSTTNSAYPASNEFWFGDSSTGWIDVKAGDVYVNNLDVSGALTTGALSLNSLQVTSDTGYIDVYVRNEAYTNTLNKIDEIKNTATFRNKYGPIAFIADVSGVISYPTDPTLREKILFGYQQGSKAIEINTYGAISLDSINSGDPSVGALTSNYGTNGQVIMSQGSASNAKWSTITDISGVIGLNNRNLQGITFVRDSSGNLDSSSNFIYDGSGVNVIANKNSQLYGLQIQNTSTGTAAAADLTLKNSTNTATIELKSTGYTAGTTIDASANMLTLSNPSGSISTNSGDKTLIGYSSNNRAIEIASSGAVSFDTSNNSGSWISNYGTSGQILSSQGSSAPPRWSTITDISGVIGLNNRNLQGITFVKDVSGNLDSSSNFIYDGSGVNVIANKNSQLYGLQIQNTSTGTAAAADLTLKNSTNTATIELKSSGYTAGTTIDAKSNILSLSNPSNPISINSGDRTLIGYSSNNRAIEIASSGAVSFDTSNNSGSWISNYGTSGQILSSQGSSAPPKWINNTGGGGGGITMANANINGIGYVIDASGNLDSSSNFIFNDNYGIYIAKNSDQYQTVSHFSNLNDGTNAAAILKLNTGPDIEVCGFLQKNSSSYQQATNSLNELGDAFVIQNVSGSVLISGSGFGSVFLGYGLSETKAIEINPYGAMSFDTSGNNDYPLTYTSNYGTSGQVLTSQGNSAPPKWNTLNYTGFPKIIYVTSAQYPSGLYDTSGTLFTYADASGLSVSKTRIITFTTSLKLGVPGINNIMTYSLYINGSMTATQTFNQYVPTNTSPIQNTLQFKYSNTNIAETIDIKFNSNDNTMDFGTSDLYIFRMEEIQ